MVSYMDVLTILLVFFVAMAAKSVVPKKPAAAAPAVSTPPALAPARPGLEAIRKQFIEQGLDARADLRIEQTGLVVSLPQAILFRPGQDRVQAAALPMVSKVAAVLERIPNRVSIVGHADTVPIHNRRFRNNWELAGARGLELLDLFAARYGIAESRLSTASYGSVAPSRSNDTADGRAQNRRVEILILDADAPR